MQSEKKSRVLSFISTPKGEFLVHFLFWFSFFSYLVWDAYWDDGMFLVFMDSLFYLLITVIGVYVNVYFLVPKFLFKNKYLLYAVTFVLLLSISTLIKQLIYSYVFPALDCSDCTMAYIFFSLFFRTVFEIVSISSIKVIKDRIVTLKRVQELEKQRLESELKFLKAQTNPHFLFNMLNNIYFLLNKSPDKAGEAILKLSNILRFKLYRVNKSEIKISDEIEIIRDFIELEKIRTANTLKVSFEVRGDRFDNNIEPFIFLTFVENAFKHCSARTDEKWVNVVFEKSDKEIIFCVENSSCQDVKVNEDIIFGIGLNNVSERLAHLYKDAYELSIAEEKETYSVYLKLKI